MGGAVPAGRRLVGRERELDLLDAALDGVGSGVSGVVELLGEPGIGKSSLLDAMVAAAEARGHLVFAGRAAEFEAGQPFGVFADAMDDYVSSPGAGVVEQLDPERLAELAAVFPSFSRRARQGGLQGERFRVHYAMRLLFERLAVCRPVVVALDDVHWADPASVELICHLLRRGIRGRVLVTLAYRPRQAQPRLLAELEVARRRGRSTTVEPRPLSPAEAAELVGDLGDELRTRLYEQSGGNPFYLEQLARAVRESAGRGRPAGVAVDGELPVPVRAALAGELDRLTPPARALLAGAAVVGEQLEPELAARAAGIDERAALSCLDELIAADLLRETTAPRRVRFRHPIVRHAVYASASAGWRLAAHRRLAAALDERGAAVTVRAHHVEQSAQPGDLTAVAVLEQAGHAAAPHAPASAARWFTAALRLLPADRQPAGGRRRLDLLEPLATSLGSAGHLAESRDVMHKILAALPARRSATRVRLIPFVALIEHLLGNHDAAGAQLRAALHTLPDPRSAEAVALRLELVSDRFYVNDNDGMHTWAREAYLGAAALGDPALRANTAIALAVAEYKTARLRAAAAHHREATGLVDELPDGRLTQLLGTFFWLGWYGQCMEHHDEAIRYLARGLALSRATGQGHLVVPMTIGSAICTTWRGRLTEAAALAEDLMEMSRLSGNDQFLTWSLSLRGWIATLSGDLAAGVADGEEAVEVARRVGDNYFAAITSCRLAETRLEAGEPHRCVAELLAAVGGPELEPVERAVKPHFYEILTRAELGRGHHEAAERWATLAERAADGITIPGRSAEALRARAAVDLARGAVRPAAAAALAAADAADRAGDRIDAGRGRLLAGRALLAGGQREAATGELTRALRELEACGARRYRDQAARELRRLGLRVTRHGARGAGAGLSALSERERQVADLVSEGRTNREIAAALFVSEKTVERHVSKLFEKLGVTGRGAVGAAIGRAHS
jgi:DNA-binding CsgD family transcriptional regulator